MLAATVGIEPQVKRQIGRIVPAERGFALLPLQLGAQGRGIPVPAPCIRPFAAGRIGPAIVKRLSGIAGKAVGDPAGRTPPLVQLHGLGGQFGRGWVGGWHE